MGTIWIKEFTGGLDTRRLPETTPGGVLLSAVNGHISRGGEFEKRAAFIKVYQLPVGTVGLGHNAKGLVVWGSGNAPVGMPAGVQYQKLDHPTVPAVKLTVVNSYSLNLGKLYVSASFADGDTYHFYQGPNVGSAIGPGILVADWDYGCAKVTFNVTAGYSIAAKRALVKFKITGGTNHVANVVTGVWVAGVLITGKSIQHTGNNATTAAKVAAEITRFVSDVGSPYVASAKGNEITVVSDFGTASNGKILTVTVKGNVTTDAPANFAGGVNHVASTIDLSVAGFDLMARTEWRTSNAATAKAVVAAINAYHGVRDYHALWDGEEGVSVMPNLPGTWANGTALVPSYTNGFTTSLTGTNNKFAGGKEPPVTPAGSVPVNLPYLPGDFVMTHDSKEYALSGSTMYFSKINDPTKWRAPDDPVNNRGEGFIDMSAQTSTSEELMALAPYQTYLAVFAYSTILIWYTDPDIDLNKRSQVLYNTGTRSPHSVCQFGDNDIYYLDESGVRSLRARDSSNSASTADIGVLVDPLVIAKLQTLTFGERLRVFGLIEPSDGRFWLIMKDVIFVFSYFSGAKVSAWSTYIPSVTTTTIDEDGKYVDVDTVIKVDEAIVFRRRLYVRSGDAIYCYGGEDAVLDYDRTEASMQTPYLDANAPAKEKSYQGWDAAVRGVWEVSASLDPTNLAAVDLLGVIDETTFPHNRMPMNGQATHVSLRFRTRSAEAAKIGSGLIHYTADGEDDGTR